MSSEDPVKSVGKTHVGLTLIRSKRKDLYFGVIKENRRKEKFTCQHKEALSYKLAGGKMLYEDGVQSG